MIARILSKPINIPGRERESSYDKYRFIKENEKIGFLNEEEELELLVNAIHELVAKKDLELAKELYLKDFKNLKLSKKDSYQKNLENLLDIKKI